MNTENELFLIEAIKNNDTQSVKKLLKKNTNPNVIICQKTSVMEAEYKQCYEEYHSLVYAAKNSFIEIVELLLFYDVSLIPDKFINMCKKQFTQEENSLYTTLLEENLSHEDIETLLPPMSYLEKENTVNKTALMYASENGNIAIASVLLDKGSEINAIDAKNKTALMYAQEFKQVDIINLLIFKKIMKLKWLSTDIKLTFKDFQYQLSEFNINNTERVKYDFSEPITSEPITIDSYYENFMEYCEDIWKKIKSYNILNKIISILLEFSLAIIFILIILYFK